VDLAARRRALYRSSAVLRLYNLPGLHWIHFHSQKGVIHGHRRVQPRDREKRDTDGARQAMKAIHLLMKHGAKWNADEKYDIHSARRTLLKIKPDYAVEFIWLLAKFGACPRDRVEALIGTPSMKRHISAHRERVHEFVNSWDRTNGVNPPTT
jgi:hypothetical protein